MWVTDNGDNWTSTFIRENSGSYNNEYIVVDTKLLANPLPAGFLWMIEQMPGLWNRTDVTSELRDRGYYQSINTPREGTDIWDWADYSGEQEKEPKRKDFWSFHGQIREKIIERDASNISSYWDFRRFMRFNNYTMDPIFIINQTTKEREPGQGIMARYDLRPPGGTQWGARNHFGGIDTKTLRCSAWRMNHSWDARLSPVFDEDREHPNNIPVFSFLDWPNISHTGITATNWTYPWIEFGPGDMCAIVAGSNQNKCTGMKGCGFCLYDNVCMAGNKDGPDGYFGYHCQAGWKYKTPLPGWAIPAIIAVSAAATLFVIVVFSIHFISQYRKGRPTRSQFQEL
jgi:hypothetical protein